MKINLAKSAGFCFGVKRAIEIALETAAFEKKVYMLGDIVHNEDVAKRIARSGIKKVKKLNSGKNKILLIRAHGVPLRIINSASRLGYSVVDATCPMVKEIHKIAKEMEKQGYAIIIIGDYKHDEVQGIKGQLSNKAIVIDSLRNVPAKKLKKLKKAAIVVQSTQNYDEVHRIVKALKTYVKNLRFFNTICKATRIRQAEIKKMPLENDLMIIIGSKASANTKRLYEISKSLNKKSYWINSAKGIKKEWFANAKNAGVTAGASTPQENIQEIVRYISAIRPNS